LLFAGDLVITASAGVEAGIPRQFFGFFGRAKDILPELPQIWPKNFHSANFPTGISCSSWLLINSLKLKHEVTGNSWLILYTAHLICCV